MLDLTAFLIAVGPVALAVTKVTDLIRNALDSDTSWPKWSWNVVPFALGIGYCLTVGPPANFVNLISGVRPEITSSLANNWGLVVSGVMLGATASFHHEWMSSMSAKSKGGTA